MALPPTVPRAGLAGDTQGVAALKAAAARDPKAAVREAAKQFEALFMQELVKSMRSATLSSGMLDNSGTKMGTEMLDAQFATQLTGLPGGLSDAIARQLERQMGVSRNANGVAVAPKLSWATPPTMGTPTRDTRIPETSAASFIAQHQAAAKAVERDTGIPAQFLIGQAAHESGWGRREILNADGSSSHNLFGIKAGASWNGAVAEVTTTEYVNGQPRKVVAKFRAYGSYEESFRDYARLLMSNPRYGEVLQRTDSASGFASALQRAGYATDPAYADKLTRVINTTLRLARAGG